MQPESPEPTLVVGHRSLYADDRDTLKRLHEDWFPVKYSETFYDEIVQGYMGKDRAPVFSIVAYDLNSGRIVGCIICQFVNEETCADEGLIIGRSRRSSEPPSVIYILTLGTEASHTIRPWPLVLI